MTTDEDIVDEIDVLGGSDINTHAQRFNQNVKHTNHHSDNLLT